MLLFRLETWDRRSVQEVLYLRYMRSAPAKMGMLEHIDVPGILYRVYCTGYYIVPGILIVPDILMCRVYRVYWEYLDRVTRC